ncbi:MAG: hypothetical protein WD757_04480 [Actinomycetota bacterium]
MPEPPPSPEPPLAAGDAAPAEAEEAVPPPSKTWTPEPAEKPTVPMVGVEEKAPAKPEPVADSFSFTPSGGASSAGMFEGRNRIIIAIVLVLVLAVVAFFLFSGGSKGQALALEFQQGKTYNYRISMTMNAQIKGALLPADQGSVTIRMGADASIEVISVDAEGAATVKVSIENVSFQTNPPIPDTGEVPESLEQTIRIGPDGKILDGGFGLSSVGGTGASVPGWDSSFFPVLPEGVAAPGDSWTETLSTPFIGGETIETETRNTLLNFEQGESGQVAVISSSTSLPLDVSVTLEEVAKAANQPPESYGVPADLDVSIVYQGEMDGKTTSWLNMTAGSLDKTVGKFTFDVDVRIEGLPAQADPGTLGFVGDIQISMTEI